MTNDLNQVNLIGKVSSLPKITELENGKRIAKFTMSTKEEYLDADGNTKTRNHWHLLSAWGRWAKVLEEIGDVGSKLAVEGKLVSRFYQSNGQRKIISEIEVNDIVWM
ncbi:MAG: single-stranded DNA-binding protein [Flavobacteriales bacterium]|jgi:single-strand DNA-binding protein